MATVNIVWIAGQPYSPNHPKALAQYRKDMEHIPTPPSLGREIKDKVAKRLRQDSKPSMNKLEQSFYDEVLLLRYPESSIRIQAIRVKLANGLWYKTDFLVLGQAGIIAFEVKGTHAFRGGFENLKMAASVWREWAWLLVWKEDGQWKEQIILP